MDSEPKVRRCCRHDSTRTTDRLMDYRFCYCCHRDGTPDASCDSSADYSPGRSATLPMARLRRFLPSRASSIRRATAFLHGWTLIIERWCYQYLPLSCKLRLVAARDLRAIAISRILTTTGLQKDEAEGDYRRSCCRIKERAAARHRQSRRRALGIQVPGASRRPRIKRRAPLQEKVNAAKNGSYRGNGCHGSYRILHI